MSATISATPGRRVVTEPAPHLLRRTTQATEDPSNTDLFKYDNPNIKVSSFNVPRGFDKPGSAPGQYEAGTIPWKSQSDQTDATGHLRIYRAPSEALMIGSGGNDWRLPMLPGSKCWCVDNEANFAMKLRDKIYRIELPFDTLEERAKVDEFKTVLSSTIRYEKDLCPFKRGFDAEVNLEDAGSPVARRQLIGTLRDQAKPYNLYGNREPRRPSSARTDASSRVFDDDLEVTISAIEVHDTQQSDIVSAPAGGEPLVDTVPSPIRLGRGGDKRSFTAPVFKQSDATTIIPAAEYQSHPEDGDVIPEHPRQNPAAGVGGDHGLPIRFVSEHGTAPASPVTPPGTHVTDVTTDRSACPEPTPEISPADQETSKEALESPQVPRSGRVLYESKAQSTSPSRDPTPEAHSPWRSSSPTPVVSGVAPAREVCSSIRAAKPVTSAADSVLSLSSQPANLFDRPSTSPPARRVSATSTDASRISGTPPIQPPAKSAPTTRTSTVTSSFRRSSLSSDDDVPSLGLFSQTLNVLLGPPSGLMSVLMGFARRVGSLSRGTASRSLGLGASVGDWEGASREFRRAGMPGSWDSEDERGSPSSDEPNHSGNARGVNGLRKTRSWASASEVAIGQKAATRSSRQRPEINREWTDDDLDR